MSENSSLTRRVAGATLIVAVISVASKFVGMLREMVVARTFGAGGDLDAFYVANTLPEMLSVMAFFVAINLFLPEYLAERERSPESADRLARAFMARAGIAFLGVALVLALTAELIVDLVAPGLDPRLRELAVLSLRLLSVLVVLRGFDGSLRGLLHAHRRFVAPVLGMTLFSVTIMVFVLVFGRSWGILALTVGWVVGGAAPVLIMAVVARNFLRGSGWRSHPLLATIARRLPWLIAIEALGLVIPLVDRALASRSLDPGAISSLAFALVLQKLPFDVIGLTVAATLFPEFATLRARRKDKEFRALVRRGIRALVAVMLPAAALFWVLHEPLVRALFERGAFDAADTVLTGAALRGYALGLPFLGVSAVLMQAAYAWGNLRMLLSVRFAALVVKFGVSLALLPVLGHVGLALGTSAFYLVFVLLLIRPMTGGFRGLVPRPLILFGATGISALVAWFGAAGLASRGWDSGVSGMVGLAVLVAVALGLYGVLCRVGKVEEVLWIEDMARRKLSRWRSE